MAVVTTSYIVIAPEGLGLPFPVGLAAGFGLMSLQGFHFVKYIYKKPK